MSKRSSMARRDTSRGKFAYSLLGGVSVVALASVWGAPALAQKAASTTDTSAAVSEIVVTGLRASLQTSQQIKQDADVFVDSITAEDIGALPDRSVTEALQRVPGVSIDRFGAGRDPDHFSVEGSGVVVRGLTFVRSEFNGRDAFTANNGQGLSFADVPAELLGGVDVFKNQSADMIEGGVAGTVNLRTRVPFDSAHRVISVSLESSYGDFSKKWGPTGSVFFSDRRDSNIGEFGVLLDYIHSDLKSRSDGQQISNFGQRNLYANGDVVPPTPGATPVGSVYLPRGAAFREDDFDHARQGFAAAGQWRSPDRTMVATLQYLRSASKQTWTEHAVEIATDNVASNGDSRAVQGTSLSFGDNGVFTNGVITGPTGWQADQFTSDPRTPQYGLQSNNQARDVLQKDQTSDLSFNFKWTPDAHWAFDLDLQHVQSRVTDFDNTLWVTTYQNAAIQLHGSDLPVVTFLPPGRDGVVHVCTPPSGSCPTYLNPPHDSFSDPYNSFVRSAMDHYEDSNGHENAAKFDAEYRFDPNSFIESVRGGARWADRDLTTRFSTYNWGVVTEQWGGNGPVWLSDPVDGIPNPNGSPVGGGAPVSGQFATFNFDNFMRGQVPVPTGAQPRLFYAGNAVSNYAQFAALATLINKEWGSNGWTPLAARTGDVAGTPFLPGEINPVDERNEAAYVMVKYGHQLDNGVNLSGNFGLRYVQIHRATQGFQAFPLTNFTSEADCATQIAANAANPAIAISTFCALPTATRNNARAFNNGATVASSTSTNLSYVLPSFNLKVDLGEGKLLRFGISKGIAPPDVGLVRNYFNVVLGTNATDIVNGVPQASNVQAGNPLLKPMRALSVDASFEWYFAKVGQLTFSVFDKQLKDVVTNGTKRETFTNNGATFDGVVSTPINSPDTGKVKGFEIGYQQVYTFLPWHLDGLGLNANYTYVDSKGVRQSTLSETDPNVAAGNVANVDTSKLPLQGLSRHTINFSPFYEKGPLSVRLAYSWRSRYLLTVRDVIVPFAPIMQESTGELDASAFYSINEHVKVGVQGVNLLNEITKTSSVINNSLLTAPRSWFMNDRRYTFILRGTF